ncbi:hypothetical protein ACFQRB_08035 [Halobaculum litoreum]|uniref:Uncharacterized protein n=1 Tax=Halobaculum litoreum TaxID=3031998 RepID=A0ABD5XMR8_9EURY
MSETPSDGGSATATDDGPPGSTAAADGAAEPDERPPEPDGPVASGEGAPATWSSPSRCTNGSPPTRR